MRVAYSPLGQAVRKDLGNLLKARGVIRVFEQGGFDNTDGSLNSDLFEDACRTSVQEIVDDVEDRDAMRTNLRLRNHEDVIGHLFGLCHKIAAARKYYIKSRGKKMKQTLKKGDHKLTPVTKVKLEEKLTPVTKVENTTVDMTNDATDITNDSTDSDVDVEDLFLVSYDCVSCGQSIESLNDVYPEENRTPDNVNHQCKTCYDAAIGREKILAKSTDKNAKSGKKVKSVDETKNDATRQDERKKEKNRLMKAKQGLDKRRRESNKSVNKKTRKYRFQLGQRVLVRYEDKWYKSHIFRQINGKYNVYCLIDSGVVSDVKEKDIKLPNKNAKWAKTGRQDCLQFEFLHDEEVKGCPKPIKKNGKYVTFRVTGIGTKSRINKYVCTHDGCKRKSYFDMAYVLRKYIEAMSDGE